MPPLPGGEKRLFDAGAAIGIDQTAADKSSLFSVRGMGPHFVDSNGACWSAAYINEGGNVVRDRRADIAFEAGARQTYESLMKLAPDQGSKKTLHTLLTREISHTRMFMKALQSLGALDDPMFGNVPPDDTVKLYFNLSKSDGEEATRGPWNEGDDVQFLADPEPRGGALESPVNPNDERVLAAPARYRAVKKAGTFPVVAAIRTAAAS